MRHRKIGKTLSRKAGPRQALLKNLAASVILHEKVVTTEAKAKWVRSYVERLITTAKKPTLANRRLLLKRLPRANSVSKLIEVIAPKYLARKGGYTRLTKLGYRQGDRAPEVLIELV